MRDAITVRVTLAAVTVATVAAVLARGTDEGPVIAPHEPPVAGAPAPTAVKPVETGIEPLTRAQIAAAVAELLGPTPATLGPAFAAVQHHGQIVALPLETDSTLWQLGERLHVNILASRGSAKLDFYGGPDEGATTDDLIEATWGAGVREDTCTAWTDHVRRFQLQRCTVGGYGIPFRQELEWSTYVTPAQWVGTLGSEPFPLIGATRAQLRASIGPDEMHDDFLRLPGLETGGRSEIGVQLVDDRVVQWWGSVNGDSLVLAKLLLARYGTPMWPVDHCCYSLNDKAETLAHSWSALPPRNHDFSGHLWWERGGVQIRVTLGRFSVSIVVEELARVRRREAESARAWDVLLTEE